MGHLLLSSLTPEAPRGLRCPRLHTGQGRVSAGKAPAGMREEVTPTHLAPGRGGSDKGKAAAQTHFLGRCPGFLTVRATDRRHGGAWAFAALRTPGLGHTARESLCRPGGVQIQLGGTLRPSAHASGQRRHRGGWAPLTKEADDSPWRGDSAMTLHRPGCTAIWWQPRISV